jgi:hypothetical protein
MARESTTVVIEKTSALAKAKGVLMTVAYRFRNRHGEWKENTRSGAPHEQENHADYR